MPTALDLIPLPIDPFVPRVVAALRGGRDVVLVAEPGAGKTTRIAPALVQCANLLAPPHGQVVMLQPRRVAARAAAARIAHEQGWTVGREVGYQVRFERVMSADTRLRVVTEGILVRRLVADPELAGVGCVILDEFHERSIHGDLSLAMLRESKAAIRPDLRLIVMSATLDAGAVASFLGEAAEVEVFHVPGRLFPVDVEYAGDDPRPIEERVARVLDALWSLPSAASRGDATEGVGGDVLVFLPGAREIEWTMSAIDRSAERRGYDVLPLHGSLTKEEQDAAVHFDPQGPPRVILATNIAETSLTLPGVRVVIDSGLVRQAGFDATRGVETLETKRISKASAAQRAGRAGRVAAGRCVRLWSKMTQHRLAEFDVPEICRVDLSESALAVRAWGGGPQNFGWYERPDERLLVAADALLEMIGAVADGRLTPLGSSLQRLPVHPRAARLVSAAPPALRQEAATAAALLGEGAEVPGRRTAGIQELIEAFARRQLDPIVWRAADRAREALLRLGREGEAPAEPSQGALTPLEELLLLAYPDRVCRRREGDPSLARLVDGGGVRLADPSAVRGELFLALDVRRGTQAQAQQADVRLVAEIEEEWLDRHLGRAVVIEQTAELIGERVVGMRRKRYRDLVLREERGGNVDPARATALLAEALSPLARALVDGDEHAVGLIRRLELLDRHLPKHLRPTDAGPPSPEGADVLADACAAAVSAGEPTVDAVRKRLAGALHTRVHGSPWYRTLQEHAPEAIEVPTGSRIKLDWTAADADASRGPVLAVRLQELFGLADTPRVCGGAVRVVVHLLGPNYRPVQVTEDLASFWRNTYPQVRKDLRARYPKHAWPEDPLAADPVRGARRRGA